ncbi:hypothetical protein QUB80_06100 [Chlorogloeopsis sp. ULAP01]|uniref:hypothetical protein n=1 Tax=Chlorogloeopsis sp. ULAP01 TaxID=3056483 RepID=UPI0025AB1206|nr:hypothetical protein [Chlorogloeopsis sp. ULAP01]MDM9380274.1 hypothetical protein [Chlorogloeopsis sp. ULAP01]
MKWRAGEDYRQKPLQQVMRSLLGVAVERSLAETRLHLTKIAGLLSKRFLQEHS